LAKEAQKKDPPSRVDKLGVKPGLKVMIKSIADPDLAGEVATREALLCNKVGKDLDLIFFGAEKSAELLQLNSLRSKIKSNGAIWVIYPKGVKQITQSDVLAAIKDAELTDIKVVSFSATHTGLKAVIPVAKRGTK
jgi:hypothetical protein